LLVMLEYINDVRSRERKKTDLKCLLYVLRSGLHRFFKTILELSQNSRRQKGDMKQVPL